MVFCNWSVDEDDDAILFLFFSQVEMVLNEVMRLFTIAPTLTRVAKRDLHLEDLFIPKGLSVELAIQAMHKDAKYWGEDVGKFNPGRFANGVLKACTPPQAFVPFSSGPKNCIAINFAMAEMKIVLSMVLRRFQLLPSPYYKHHPQYGVVQRPKYGLHLILQTL
jgi:cytochrome P450